MAFQTNRLPDSIERGMIMSRRNEKYELKNSSHLNIEYYKPCD